MMADAMFTPVVTRLRSYDVALDATGEDYARTIIGWPDFRGWVEAAWMFRPGMWWSGSPSWTFARRFERRPVPFAPARQPGAGR